MRKLKYLLAIGSFFLCPLLKAGEAPPEGITLERANLEKEQERLEKEQKELDQRRLLAEQQHDQSQQTSIEQQQAIITEQLQEVEGRLAAVPELGGQTVPSKQGTGTVVVEQPVTEQQIVQAATPQEWQKEWQQFAERPGKYWGNGGSLFTDVPSEQRAQRIIDIVNQTPLSLFSQDPVEGINNLGLIADQAQFMREKNLLTPDESDHDYAQIMKAVADKMRAVVEHTSFPGAISSQINHYVDLLSAIHALQAGHWINQVPLENLIIRLVAKAISNSTAQASPSEILDELSNGATRQALEAQLDTFPQETKNGFFQMLSNKMIDVFKEAPLESLGNAKTINQTANSLLNGVLPILKQEAQTAVVNKLIEYVNTIDLSQDPLQALDQLSDNYTTITSGLNLSGDAAQDLQVSARRAFENTINPALNLPVEASLDVLLKIAKEGDRFLAKLPEVRAFLLAKINVTLSNELSNHLLTSAIDTEAKNAQELYLQAYTKEVDYLNTYLNLLKTDPQALQSQKTLLLETAQRLAHLSDFIAAQRRLKANERMLSSFNKLDSKIKNAGKFISTLAKEPLANFLEKNNNEFWQAEQNQKKLLGLGVLPALPEDIFAGLNRQANDLLDQISQTTDAKTLSELYSKLEKINSDLNTPLIIAENNDYGFTELLIDQTDIKTFKDLTKQLAEKISERKIKFGQNTERLRTMRGEVESILTTLNTATLVTIGESKEALDKLSEELATMTLYGVPDEAVPSFQKVFGQVEAWRNVIATAESFKAAAQAGSTRTQAQQALTDMTFEAQAIPRALSYEGQTIFTNRLDLMKQQQQALDKLNELLKEPRVSVGKKDYDLIQMGEIMHNFAYRDGIFSPEIMAALVSNGYVTQESSLIDGNKVIIYTAADKGLYLASIAAEQVKLERRANQLGEYRSRYEGKSEPSSVMLSLSKRPILLADAYNLNLLIYDDQVNVLEFLYRRNITPDSSSLEFDKLMDRLNPDYKEVKLTPEQQNILSDKRALLQDISDVLAVQRTQLKEETINPYFEALVEYQAKLLDMSPGDQVLAQQVMNRTKMVTYILALSDPVAALTWNTPDAPNALEEIKTLYKELGGVLTEGLRALSTRWDAAKLNWQENASTVAWYSIIPSTVAAFFATKIAVGYGSPVLGGAVGAAVGGPVGAAAGAAVGNLASGLVANVAAAFAGLATGVGLYFLSKELAPGQQALQEYNDRLVQAGYKPEEMPQRDPGFWEQTVAKMQSWISSELTNMVTQVDTLRPVVEWKENTANQARHDLYNTLGLEDNARAAEVEAAFKLKEAELDKSLFLNRWLGKRRLTNAYRFMLETRQDAIRAKIEYNQVLAQIMIKVVGKIADDKASPIRQALSTIAAPFGTIWSYFTGEKQVSEKMTPDQVSRAAQDLIAMYKGQVADLMALEKEMSNRSELINKASPFGDNTVTEVFRDILNNRIDDLYQDYQRNVNEVLKAQGVKSLAQGVT